MTNFYTPQQNGIAKRISQTLMGMATTKLMFKHINNNFWIEVGNTTMYLRNRSPYYLYGIIPFEGWYEFNQKSNILEFLVEDALPLFQFYF